MLKNFKVFFSYSFNTEKSKFVDRLFIIVSLLSHEWPRHQNLGYLYRKTHNKKTKKKPKLYIIKNQKHSLTKKSLKINIKTQKF